MFLLLFVEAYDTKVNLLGNISGSIGAELLVPT